MKKKALRIGDVVWINLRDEGRHIQKGVRPAVIVQNNKGNRYSPTVQVVPLTSKMTKSHLPTHVYIPMCTAGLSKDSIVQCEGARPVSKEDIIGYIGTMPDEYMRQISVALIISTPVISFLNAEDLMGMYTHVRALN